MTNDNQSQRNLVERLGPYKAFLVTEKVRTGDRMESIGGQSYFEEQSHQISALGNGLQAYEAAIEKLEDLFPESDEQVRG